MTRGGGRRIRGALIICRCEYSLSDAEGGATRGINSTEKGWASSHGMRLSRFGRAACDERTGSDCWEQQHRNPTRRGVCSTMARMNL